MSAVKSSPVVCLVGAGSAEFTRQLLRDLMTMPELADCRIVLHDLDPRRLDLAEAIARTTIRHHGAGASVTGTTDRRAALDGADFVVNMVSIGGHAATLTDFDVPEQFGVRQTIGDTLGVGGIFRGLRTFGFLGELAADILQLCPDAWLLNYTNPMAMNIGYLNTVAPQLKVLGLCHSVYWTVHDLSALVGVPLEDVSFRSAGVNHQAWLLEWSRDGESLYPRLDAAIEADPELRRRVRVEMYRRLGYYPTETSEHSSEYLSWFLRSPEQIERYRLRPLEYLGISEQNVAEFEDAKQALASGRPLELEEGAAEYAPQVIHSIVTGTPREIHGNVVNRGLIDNHPEGAVVEVPCAVDADGVHPIPMGALPPQLAAVNRPYLAVAALAVEAMRTGDPALVRQSVLVDPNASSSLTPDAIWALCDELTAAHGDRIPAALR